MIPTDGISTTDEPGSLLDSYVQAERRMHEAFAASRRGLYVERESAIVALDAFAADTASTAGLVVTGERGAGKTALLANWAWRYRSRCPSAFVVEHYIGTSSAGLGHIALIRRVIAEIKLRYRIVEPLPTTSDLLEESLPHWLAMVRDEPLILVIDALNQLDRPLDVARWLPEYLQPRVRVIASAIGAELLEILSARSWSVWRIDPLSPRERSEIIARFLHEHQAHPCREHCEGFAAIGTMANPLFLRTSLEELRLASCPEKCRASVQLHLAAKDTAELMGQVLDRAERSFGRRFVKSVLAHLSTSRGGLTLDEVTAMTGGQAHRIRALVESLSLHLVARDGRIGFFDEQFHDTVRARYLPTPSTVAEMRRRIVEHFSALPVDGRSALEVPWQLMHLERWDDLAACIADPAMLDALIRSGDHAQLIAYWSTLSDHEDHAVGQSLPQSPVATA